MTMHDPVAFVLAFSQIAAAIALLNGILVPIGQGNAISHAIDGIVRQPEAKGSVTTTMFIGCGLAETSGVYGVAFAFIMLFANPIVNHAMNFFG